MLQLSDLHNHSFERQIAGEFGNGVHKEIICKVIVYADFPPEVEFIVKENGTFIKATPDLNNAVDKFNSLPRNL